MTDDPLLISYPGQCCRGYCIEGIEVHDLSAKVQAEVVVRRVRALMGEHGTAEPVSWRNRETLRADDAEATLRVRERQLARILDIADAWEKLYAGRSINSDAAVAALRDVIRVSRHA